MRHLLPPIHMLLQAVPCRRSAAAVLTPAQGQQRHSLPCPLAFFPTHHLLNLAACAVFPMGLVSVSPAFSNLGSRSGRAVRG